jgi:hypothetical protein
LQPYFLARLLKSLQKADGNKAMPALNSWLEAAAKAKTMPKPGGTTVAIPDSLRTWSEGLQREVRSALQENDRRGGGKKNSALLKALWQDANAPFAVSAKDAADLLEGADRTACDAKKAEITRHKQSPPPAPVMVHGIKGGGQAMRVNIRGNVERLGEPAPPGFLRILRQEPSSGTPGNRFTRLDLAEAIASARNPLTARVYVNRVWQHHFGRGLVGTASNFGQLGERPTHPELLDTLTVRFVESGWSTRWLHREIMLSAAYQLSTRADADNAARDVDNRYLWRMSPRRLDLEAWRDAMLAVSGRLDQTLGGPSFDLNDAKNARRTVYARVSRAVPNTMAALFDFPDANATSERRNVTTVPQQQLFVLNSPFLIEAAKAFAARLEKTEADPQKRIVLAFRLAFGRPSEEAETREALQFLRTAPVPADRLNVWEQFAQALLAANEFNWVD